MDFIVFSTLVGVLVTYLTLSYDICCQWSRNLKRRVSQLPDIMQVAPMTLLRKVKCVIPKFHLHNHGLKCHLNFNLNFLRFSAQSDLEDPERWWAHINPISMSTREMTAGSRIDLINDHAAGWNWRKITGFGKSSFSDIDLSFVTNVVSQDNNFTHSSERLLVRASNTAKHLKTSTSFFQPKLSLDGMLK